MSSPIGLDKYAFSLAVILIGAFVTFYGLILYFDKTPGYEGLKTVSSTLGNIVASIVGYYFGQRPVHAAHERAQEATNKSKENAKAVLGQIDKGQEINREISKELESLQAQAALIEKVKQRQKDLEDLKNQQMTILASL